MGLEIIAEIAQGYEGKPHQAAALIAAAAAAGADAAKLQLVYAAELAAPSYKYYDLFRTLEMPDTAWAELADFAREKNIALHLDVFGQRSLALAERVGAAAVKVHGTDMANEGLLKAIALSSIPRVLLACGGAMRSEIERALKSLAGKKIALLFGFQGYPTPNEANQISRLRAFTPRAAASGGVVAVGFADHAPVDHALRFALPATAVGAGATALEKHLTLAQVMRLEDHEAALNPDDFAEFVRLMRACYEAVGACAEDAEDFGMDESELGYRRMVRKHVVALRPLSAGVVLAPDDLALKRTPAADVMEDIAEAYGRRLTESVEADEALSRRVLTEDCR
jgi:N,N'-diacetyllegionaminate synthase